jgi:hypothetical protein
MIVEINGDWFVRNEGCNYSEYHGEWFVEGDEDYVWSETENDWLPIDVCTYVDSLNDYYLSSECYEVDGKYYHESQVNKL